MVKDKKLNLKDIFCIATGAMISSGLFVLPAIAYRYSGPSIILAYLVAGLLMIPSIFSKSELLTAMPKSGGTYFFIERSFGPLLGIFGGLASWFSLSLKSAFALIGIGVFLEYFLPSASSPQLYFFIKLIAASFCIVFVLVNIFSVRLSARLQNVLVFFLLTICVSYIVFGIKNINYDNFRPFMSKGVWPFFSVVGLVFVSYGGLTKVASIAEETKDPSRTIPVGMFLSFLVVQVIYVLSVAVTIGLLSSGELTSTFTPLTHGAIKIGGITFGIVISLAALAAFITTANAGILSSARVPYAMAKDSLLPSKFSLVSKKFNTPYVSIIFTGLFMLFLILFLDLENLVKTASTLMIILFIFDNLSVIIMRQSRLINYRPNFRSPFYPWMQIFAIFAYGFLIFKMGIIPLAISAGFIGVSLIWFGFSSRKIKRQSALMHIVERVTAKEFVDISLEDELKEILHKRDNVIKDRFDHLIEKCLVLDLDKDITRDGFLSLISEALHQRLDIDKKIVKDLLIEREEQSTTVIEKGLALPHIVVEGKNKFEIVIVRSKEGLAFSHEKDPVHIVFVLAGSKDERNFHLRSLMAIAQIVQGHNFHKDWMRMKDGESLRMLVLSSTRKRDI
ncbi:MAG: amino acid permease [Candidatus Omnitrophica bacterium]|nr:amino acid permease [Candidatus Omnitrophota bacterium]